MAEEVTPGEEQKVVVKKKRGNPAFSKGRNNPYYDKEKKESMAETQEPVAETKTEGVIDATKQEIPNDVFSDEIPAVEVLPLDDEVKTKTYGAITDTPPPSPNGGGGGSQSPPPPPGPDSSATSNATADPLGQPQPTSATTAPPMTPDEVKTQAEQTVRMMIKVYEKLHGIGRYVGKVPQEKLLTAHAKGEIDMDEVLPLSKKGVSVKEFFEHYNANIDETIVVSQSFKDDITPPMVRIAIKRGWLVSDEIYVMMALAEDLATKVAMVAGLKKSANMIMEACIMMKKERENPGSTRTTTTPASNTQSAQDFTTTEEVGSNTMNPGPGPEENSAWREPEA